MQHSRVELPFGRFTLSLETGKLAKQAGGAAVVRMGDTSVMVSACEGSADPNKGFFPLSVDYRERVSSAGKFPGGFIKRETRPSTKDTLTSRLIDRPIRPLFPAGYMNEIQIIAFTLSADRDNDPDMLAMIGSSAALHVSDIPLLQPTGSVRVGHINGEFVAFPTYHELEESDLDLIVSGTRDAVTMIEGFAREMPEDRMLAALAFAHEQIIKIIGLIEQLRTGAGLSKKVLPPAKIENPAEKPLAAFHTAMKAAKTTRGKVERSAAVKAVHEKAKADLLPAGVEKPYNNAQFNMAMEALEERVVRDAIMEGTRIDGRAHAQLRNISCEVGVIPRVHGSALFQRGETQALVTIVLGTAADEQKVDGIADEYSKKFMLDYNFPPFSVGECKPMRGPGRREIGHGMLAERSLKAISPNPQKFPYTIRIISDILESNGSSSMASVCGGTLALMDAGVPITNPVAGISIGLVKEANRFTLLTDIQGDEDHYGDMDFKIAGSQRGITGIQLDLKIAGINQEIIKATLEQARLARIEILRNMLQALRAPRAAISVNAPRLLQVKINPEKIGLLIGPGGKTIKGIQEATGAKLDVAEDGTVQIAHSEAAGAEEAKRRVEALTEEVKIGKIYDGKVSSIKEFGAFIEIMPGRDGLCHISELSDQYVGRVDEIVKVGDKIQVKVIGIDDQDRVKLSRKALLREASGEAPIEEAPQGDRPPRDPRSGGSDRGGRGGPRRGGPRRDDDRS